MTNNGPDIAGLVDGAVRAMVTELIDEGIQFEPTEVAKVIDAMSEGVIGIIRTYLLGYSAGLSFQQKGLGL